ncbi:MAG: PQQ-binding-like beta-propeller repeat protein [Patescibacteria group bacterium]
MKKSFLLVVLAVTAIFCSSIVTANSQSRVNAQHTGYYANVNGPETANVKWVVNIGTKCGLYPSPIIDTIGGGERIICSTDSGVVIFNPNGTLWEKIGTGYQILTGTATLNGFVFFGAKDSLIVINSNLNDTSNHWSYYIGSNATSPTVFNNKVYICAGKKLYCFNDSTLEWSTDAGKGANPTSAPTIGDSGRIYVATKQDTSYDYRIYCFNPNGIQRWIYESNNGERTGIFPTPVVDSSGNIYVSTYARDSATSSFYAVTENGWEAFERFLRNCYAAPAIYGGNIICCTQNGIWAVNRSNNTTTWHWTSSDSVFTTCSPIIDANGKIFVATDKGLLLAITKNGSCQWFLETQEGPIESAVLGADGTLYVLTCSGKLYAIGRDIATEEKGNIVKDIMVFPTVSSTKFAIQAPEKSKICVYDIAGKLVKTVKGSFWNGTNELNQRSPSGMYFINFTVGERKVTKKLIWVK